MTKKVLIIVLTFSVLFRTSLQIISAEDVVSELNNKVIEYTKKIDELNKSKDTLANQIQILNSQVSLTLLKISQTEASIKTLEQEISSLTKKIGELDINLNQLSTIYIRQVAENYKLSKRYPAIAIISSKNFNEMFQQYKLVSVVQKSNQNTLIDLETVRTNYDIQKEQKRLKQAELETLEKKLADQQASLSKQKLSKVNLLEITKNNEVKYQQLKKAAEDELNSLLKAKFVGKRSVKQGDPIGTMGNSGYSFGDHLHFGLYNLKEENIASWVYVNDIDPVGYIKEHIWPMSDPLEITQGRGQTKYSYLYADHFHHGIDMVSSNKTVKSVADGVAYFYRNPQSSLGNHVKIFHSDGKMSLYLHLQ